MADLSREELRRALEGLGETPNPHWRKVELRHRLHELTGEDMGRNVKSQSQGLTPCQALIKELNKASRKKKSEVIKFCMETLHLSEQEVTNKTVAQLQMMAMSKIMLESPADAMDQVNFGKHHTCRYHEILAKHYEYGKWVQKTFLEHGPNCDPRFQRLAKWLIEQEKAELQPDKLPAQKIFQGYTKGPAPTSPMPASSTASSSMENDVLKEMIGAIRDLQKEVQNLKQEPVRKKAPKHEDSEAETDGSFMRVSRSP